MVRTMALYRVARRRTPDEEREILNAWVVDHVGDPLYFYGRQGPRVDLRSKNDDLRDDAVATSNFGIANL